MDTEDFILNNGSKAEVVKDLCAVFPDIEGSILSQTLIIETINLGNLSRFVVASDQGNSIRISDLFKRG